MTTALLISTFLMDTSEQLKSVLGRKMRLIEFLQLERPAMIWILRRRTNRKSINNDRYFITWDTSVVSLLLPGRPWRFSILNVLPNKAIKPDMYNLHWSLHTFNYSRHKRLLFIRLANNFCVRSNGDKKKKINGTGGKSKKNARRIRYHSHSVNRDINKNCQTLNSIWEWKMNVKWRCRGFLDFFSHFVEVW